MNQRSSCGSVDDTAIGPKNRRRGETQGPSDYASASTPTALVLKQARRVLVLVIGGTILLLGAVLLFTPGPAFVVIPIGLSILATEFVWARRWLRRLRDTGRELIGWDRTADDTPEAHEGSEDKQREDDAVVTPLRERTDSPAAR